MLSSLTLKCANCGANLEIKSDTETFTCGYCGASQLVERHGGTVSLKLLTDSISKVQIGTDKTAAELALRRLKDEMLEIDNKFRQIDFAMNQELSKSSNGYLMGFVIVSVFFLCRITTGESYAGITVGVWVIGAIGFFFAWSKRRDTIIGEYNPKLEELRTEYKNLESKSEEHKRIVNS